MMATSMMTTDTGATMTPINVDVVKQGMVNNHALIWIDESMNRSDHHFQNALAKLREIVNEVYLFTKPDPCVDLLTDLDEQEVSLVASQVRGQQLLPYIHDVSHLKSIYIIGNSQEQLRIWAKTWSKIKGVYTSTLCMCEDLQKSLQRCNYDTIPISFVSIDDDTTNTNPDQLEPSFMYTQLFKNTLLTMNYDNESRQAFIDYCREHLPKASSVEKMIDQFAYDYHSDKAVCWYTRESFVYKMLNEALRLLNAEIIMIMGFFIRDLHRQIERLHRVQMQQHREELFVVYRGQILLSDDFEKLKKNKSGLISFNSFLSTSMNKNLPLQLAESAAHGEEQYGILFVITIDSKIDSVVFANISRLGYFKAEEEILFSMNTVFRIGHVVNQIQHKRLFEVHLTLTDDHDKKLRTLTNQFEAEMQGMTATARLANILGTLENHSLLGKLYRGSETPPDDILQKFEYHSYHALANQLQGKWRESQEHLDKTFNLQQNVFKSKTVRTSNTHSVSATSSEDGGKSSEVVTWRKHASDPQKTTLSENHPSLANSYTNIGLTHYHMRQYSKALSFLQNAREMRRKTLPENHSSLAYTYSYIGSTYHGMGESSRALLFHEKALEIGQKTLPDNHPLLATVYSNIGLTYDSMRDYAKAHSFHEKALDIQKKILPATHSRLAFTYSNLGYTYQSIEEYSKALSSYEQALEIRKKIFPDSHSLLAQSYGSIGVTYNSMGEYSKALSFHENALDLQKKALPENHLDVAFTYYNIGWTYHRIEEYSKALSFYEQALEIRKKIFPGGHPSLAHSYGSISETYNSMGDFPGALSCLRNALEIQKKILPENHLDLAFTYNDIGWTYQRMGEEAKALSFHELALEIRNQTVPDNHQLLAISNKVIGLIRYKLKNYDEALGSLLKALDIWRECLPENHPNIQNVIRSIETLERRL